MQMYFSAAVDRNKQVSQVFHKGSYLASSSHKSRSGCQSSFCVFFSACGIIGISQLKPGADLKCEHVTSETKIYNGNNVLVLSSLLHM